MKNKMNKLFSCLIAVVVAVSCMAYVATNMTSALEFSFDSVTGTTEYNEDNTQATIKFDLSKMPKEFTIKQFIDENYLDLDHKEDTNDYSMVVTENKTYTFNIIYSDGSKDDQGNDIETTVKKEVVVDGIKEAKEEVKETDPEKVPAKASVGVTITEGESTKIDMSTVTGSIAIKSDGLYVGGNKEDPLETEPNPKGYEFSGTGVNKPITVTAPTAILIFAGVDLSSSNGNDCIQVSHTDTTIILKAGTTNTIKAGTSGTSNCIEKNGLDGKLTIKSSDGGNTASLMCSANSFHTGCITSTIQNQLPADRLSDAAFSNFYFESGKLTIKAGNTHNPGIGAACHSGSSKVAGISKDIYITGGILDVTGGASCAGIGSGAGVPVDGIYISNGAQVTATGGAYSPGIGSGGTDRSQFKSANFSVKNIEIIGGQTKVTAYGDSATNMPGIGCGKDYSGRWAATRVITNIKANPETNYQGYVKYGTSDTDYAFSTANPTTPFPSSEEFGAYLQGESDKGNPVYYTQVYFGPYKDNNAIDPNAEIGSNDTVVKTGGESLSTEDLIKLTVPTGHNENGADIDFSNYTLNPDEVKAINDAKTAGKVGDFPLTYTYSYTDTTGDHTLKVVSTVSLREEGDPDNNNIPSIGANGAIHKTGGDAFTDEEVVKLTDALANNSQGTNAIKKRADGSLVIPDNLVIDATELNEAKVAGKTGTFNVKYTYTDGDKVLTVTVPVTLTDNGSDTVEGPEIGSNNVSKRSDGKSYTAEEIKKDTGVVARDSNGNIVDSSKLIPNAAQLKVISEARKNKKEGEFDIEFTFEDVDGTFVTVTSKVTLYYVEPPVITAQDTTISSDEAKKITDKKDLINIMKAEVTLIDGTKVTPTGVETPNFEQIKNGVPGSYKVTFTYTTEDGEVVTVTKILTISGVKVTNSTSKTGDNTNMTGYIVLALLSSMFLLVIGYKRKKELYK